MLRRGVVDWGVVELAVAAAVAGQSFPAWAQEPEAPAAETEPHPDSPEPSSADPAAAAVTPGDPGVDPLAALYTPDPGGLTLGEAMRRARQYAPSLGRQEAQARKTETQSDWAVSVFVPRIDLSGSYTRLSEYEIDPESVAGALGGQDVAQAFGAIWDNWLFSTSAQINISEYFLKLPMFYVIPQRGHLAQLAQVQAEREAVSLRAAQAYFGLLAARAAADVARQGAETLQGQVHNLERLQSAGMVTLGEVMALRAQASALESQVIAAEGGARTAEIQLRQVVRFDGDRIPLSFALGERPPAPDNDVDAGVRLAVDQRPELDALRATLSMREAITTSHLASVFPRLFVRGQIDVANPNQRIFPLAPVTNTTWFVTVGLTWSPNDTITSSQAWLESQAEEEALAADLQGLADAIELEVSSAVNDWEVAERSIGAADVRVRAARIALQEMVKRFEAGEATTQDLLDREQAYREAALARLQSAIDLHLARLRYDRAVGQLNDGTPARAQGAP